MAIAGLVSVIVAGGAGRCRAARPDEDSATRADVPAAGAQQATPARTFDPLENFPPRTIEPTMVPNTPPPTPAADTPAVPPTRATAAAAAALSCKQMTAALASGDQSAFASLPADKKNALGQAPVTVRAFTCLAIANDSRRYCDALPAPHTDYCAAQWQLVRDLKSSPKESVKTLTLYQMCLRQTSRAECDSLRQAMTTHDAGKCGEFGDVSMRVFCAGLATGDASKCEGLSDAAERDRCAALATDDPNRCSKDASECVEMARGFAQAKQEGLQGLERLDPDFAAASKGKAACTGLVAALEGVCTSTQIGAVVTPSPLTALPTPHQ